MNIANMTIRAYDPARDTQRLCAIWLEASRIAHPFIGEERLIEQRRLIEEVYLPESKTETRVACLDGTPAGFIALLGTFIGGLFVAPDQQGHGIGRLLVEDALSRRGALSLEVYTANEAAFGFYKALGFREVSRRDVDDEGYPFENARLELTR